MRLAIGLTFWALAFLIIGLAIGFSFDVGVWIGVMLCAGASPPPIRTPTRPTRPAPTTPLRRRCTPKP